MYYQIVSKSNISLERVSYTAKNINKLIIENPYVSTEYLNHYINDLNV